MQEEKKGIFINDTLPCSMKIIYYLKTDNPSKYIKCKFLIFLSAYSQLIQS